MKSTLTAVNETTTQWAQARDSQVEVLTETTSTQDLAKARAMSESAEFALYITAHQTAGRGRGSNTWLDTGAGEGLLSSWSFALPAPPQAITGPRVGLALFSAAKSTWPSLAWSLKAPNDLYLEGLKVAGLLIEAVSSGDRHRLIVGLGMNVLNHPRRFQTATHLSASLDAPVEEGEWYQFLDELQVQLNQALREVTQPTLSSVVCGQVTHALNANPERTFTVTKISPQGDLVHADGVVRWEEL
jgi:BirA family biotin operon repressor/biotin-[acetyl-CoA-carboxylase] ligase